MLVFKIRENGCNLGRIGTLDAQLRWSRVGRLGAFYPQPGKHIKGDHVIQQMTYQQTEQVFSTSDSYSTYCLYDVHHPALC